MILSYAKMVHSNELAQSVVKFDYVAIYNDVVKFNKSAILFMGKYLRWNFFAIFWKTKKVLFFPVDYYITFLWVQLVDTFWTSRGIGFSSNKGEEIRDWQLINFVSHLSGSRKVGWKACGEHMFEVYSETTK